MGRWGNIGVGAIALVGGALAFGVGAYRLGTAEAEEAYRSLLARPDPPTRLFHPDQVADLPEVAQRYFRHAIAPGTPLYSVAELEMQGTFLLGDKHKFQRYDMSARQVLRPPDQFVWVPRLRSGATTIIGSDGLVSGEAWTRFWLFGLIPVANTKSSPDLVQSAQFRAAVEGALWVPTALLPENGVKWEQVEREFGTALSASAVRRPVQCRGDFPGAYHPRPNFSRQSLRDRGVPPVLPGPHQQREVFLGLPHPPDKLLERTLLTNGLILAL
jgi:hypothetical protein